MKQVSGTGLCNGYITFTASPNRYVGKNWCKRPSQNPDCLIMETFEGVWEQIDSTTFTATMTPYFYTVDFATKAGTGVFSLASQIDENDKYNFEYGTLTLMPELAIGEVPEQFVEFYETNQCWELRIPVNKWRKNEICNPMY